MGAHLGEQLKHSRSLRGHSLEAASRAAKISQGYLHKLEAGRVNSPSPRVLQRLSEALDVPYRRLMVLAGYLMPDDARPEDTQARSPDTDSMPADDQAPSATNAQLLRLLETVRAELAEIKADQQRLAQALHQLTGVDE